MNLGVYVTTMDEEVLIESVLRPVIEVFPQVEVIDVGSRDNTLQVIDQFDVPVHKYNLRGLNTKKDGNVAGQEYERLKNVYADKHEWCIFIDGDEIYNIENLNMIKEKAGNPEHTAYRVGWKMVREQNGQKQIAPTKINGCKLFKTSEYYHRRAWPYEVLQAKNADNREPKQKHSIWCWHGVLLQRSKSVTEHPVRLARRLNKAESYARELQWTNISEWPWL